MMGGAVVGGARVGGAEGRGGASGVEKDRRRV